MARTKTEPKRTTGAVARASKSAPTSTPKKRRFKPIVRAMREIRKQQRNVELLIPKAVMQRLIREVAHEHNTDLRFTQGALGAAHMAAEDFLIDLFDDAATITAESNRVKTYAHDMHLAALLTLKHNRDYANIFKDRDPLRYVRERTRATVSAPAIKHDAQAMRRKKRLAATLAKAEPAPAPAESNASSDDEEYSMPAESINNDTADDEGDKYAEAEE